MIRPLTLFWFLMAATAVGMVFVISHEVTMRERQMNRMRAEVEKTRDRIHVLRAEWAYLGRPQYLEQLASQHLGLASMPPDRIIEIGDLPRPEDRPAEDPMLMAKGKKPQPSAPAAVAGRAGTPAPVTTASAPAAAAATAAKPAAKPAPAPLGNRAATAPAFVLPPVLPLPAARSPIAPASATRSVGSLH